MSTIVMLNQEEVRICTFLAVERWLAKFNSTDRPNYAIGKSQGKLEPELNANIRANIAEWAVARQMNLGWNVPWYPNELHRKRSKISDVGQNIEVRTVRTQNAIPLWPKDKDKVIVGAKVLDTEYFSTVEIYGHYNANDAFKDEWKDDSIQGWRIPVEEFIDAQ
jgi:hypothetical protein